MKTEAGKAPVTIHVDEKLRIRMIELRISPTTVAIAAFREEVKKRESRQALRAIRRIDPIITTDQITSKSNHVRKLKALAEVLDPSIAKLDG